LIAQAAAIVTLALSAPTAAAPSDAPAPSLESPKPPAPPTDVYDVHLAVDIPVTVLAGSFGLMRVLFEDRLARESCPCDPSRLNALDRGTVGNHSRAASIGGDVVVYGVMGALPVLDLLDVGWKKTFGVDLMVYVETLAVDTAIQNAVNFAVSRPRPRTYAGDPAFLKSGEGYLSFYAGHVATAFSALSAASFTLRRRHQARIWPWIVTGILGGSVAALRVASGHHFPTDVAVAALAGITTGITVPWLHARNRPRSLAIVPGLSGQGLSLVGNL
jgi:membrane-associated phospholipid phosphatase